jgi:hypothetical protein
VGPEKLRAAAGESGLREALEKLRDGEIAKAKAHVSSQWIYGEHMAAANAYTKALNLLAAPVPAAPAQPESVTYERFFEPRTGEPLYRPAAQPDTAQLRSARDMAYNIKQILGTGACELPNCEGCQWERKEATELVKQLFELLAALAAQPPTVRPACEDCDTASECHGLGNCPATARPVSDHLSVDELEEALRLDDAIATPEAAPSCSQGVPATHVSKTDSFFNTVLFEPCASCSSPSLCASANKCGAPATSAEPDLFDFSGRRRLEEFELRASLGQLFTAEEMKFVLTALRQPGTTP